MDQRVYAQQAWKVQCEMWEPQYLSHCVPGCMLAKIAQGTFLIKKGKKVAQVLQ